MIPVLVTCADILLRVLRISFSGAYDIVKIAAAMTIACGLPYTTAVKGHVAVEFFFHRLGRRGRIVADALIRLATMVLFSLLTWQFVHYGIGLKKSGDRRRSSAARLRDRRAGARDRLGWQEGSED